MTKGLLTVGVPVHNQVDTIAETIESLLAQERAPAEIVVSENHSTDGTAEVVARYRDRVRIVRPPRPLSMMANWNFCIGEMTTPWFSLLSGDDLARPNFVAALERGTTVVPDAVLVRAGWENIDGTGRVLDRRRLFSVRRVTRPPRTFLEQLRGPRHGFAAFALRREAWQAVGGFPESLQLWGDWGMWLQVAPAGAFVYEDEIISGYRIQPRPELSVKRFALQASDELVLLKSILPSLMPHGVPCARITAAGRHRLLDFLTLLGRSREHVPVEAMDATMTELAALAGMPDAWADWKRGRVPRPLRPLQWARARLRRIYGLLRR